MSGPSTPHSSPAGNGGASSSEPEQAQLVRTAEEFQRAHDLLVTLMRATGDYLEGTGEFGLIAAATDVLCWALGHDHNQSFAQNLEGIERRLTEAGIVLVDAGRLIRP